MKKYYDISFLTFVLELALVNESPPLYDFAIWPAVIGGLAALAGGVVSGLLNRKTSKDTMNQQLENQQILNQQQNDFNVQQWERNNEYNSPSAQYQRLEEAGINPSVAFGGQYSSVASAPVTQGSSSASAASNNPFDFSNIVSSALSIGQLQMMEAQSENLVADSRLKDANAELANAQTVGQLWDNSNKSEAWDKNKSLIDSQIIKFSKEANLTEEQTKNLQILNDWLPRLKQAELNQFVEQLKLISAKVNTEKANQAVAASEVALNHSKQSEITQSINESKSRERLNDANVDVAMAERDNVVANRHKTEEETKGVTLGNHEKALRAILSKNGINPDSKGYDKLLETFVMLTAQQRDDFIDNIGSLAKSKSVNHDSFSISDLLQLISGSKVSHPNIW